MLYRLACDRTQIDCLLPLNCICQRPTLYQNDNLNSSNKWSSQCIIRILWWSQSCHWNKSKRARTLYINEINLVASAYRLECGLCIAELFLTKPLHLSIPIHIEPRETYYLCFATILNGEENQKKKNFDSPAIFHWISEYIFNGILAPKTSGGISAI